MAYTNDVYQETKDWKLVKVERGGYTRRCSSFETMFARSDEVARFILHQYIEIESDIAIDNADVMKAVEQWLRKYPVLQLKIEKKNNAYWFKLMEEKVLNVHFAEEDIDEVFRDTLSSKWDVTEGPLWKIIFVRPPNKDNVYGLIFSIDHTISDFTSSYLLLGYLARFLGKDPEMLATKTQPLPPPMRNAISIPKYRWIPNMLKHWYPLLKAMFRDLILKRSHVSNKLDSSGGDPSLQYSHDALNEDETKTLLNKCKCQNVSVNACVTVACCIAMLRAANIRKQSKREFHDLTVGHPLCLRRYFSESHSNVIGTLAELHYSFCRTADILDQSFWKKASQVHEKIHINIKQKYWSTQWVTRRQFNQMVDTNTKNIEKTNKMMHGVHVTVNNMGRIDKYFSLPEDSFLRVTKLRRAAMNTAWLAPCVLGLETFRKELHLTISYTNRNISTPDAERILANVVSILREIVARSDL